MEKIQGTQASTQDFPGFTCSKLLACSVPSPGGQRRVARGRRCQRCKHRNRSLSGWKCLKSVYEARPAFCHAQTKEAGRSWQVLHSPEHPEGWTVLWRGSAAMLLPGKGSRAHCRGTVWCSLLPLRAGNLFSSEHPRPGRAAWP